MRILISQKLIKTIPPQSLLYVKPNFPPKSLTKYCREISSDTIRLSRNSVKNAPDADLYYLKSNNSFYLDNNNSREVEPYYYISKLWSLGKGSGTKGVQEVVNKSLRDKETMGRVFLDAECMDRKTSPAGFYYKLGFRFHENVKNEIFCDWLKHGGQKSQAPMVTGLMYLPSENILHCLTYGYSEIEKELILKEIKTFLSSGYKT